MKFNPSFWIVVLVVLVNIQTAIGRHDISLEHMFPASWIDSIVAWHVFLAYIGTAIIGAIAAPSAFRKAGAAAAVLIVAFVLMFSPGVARAADLATKAVPTVQPVSYPTTKCGMYLGLDTKGATGTVENAAVGTQMVQGAIGLTIGYTCPTSFGYMFGDADFDFANVNGSQNGLSLTGPAVFEQRFGVGLPMNQLIALVPWLSQLESAVPSLQPLPSGVSVVTSNPNIYLATSWDDVGAQYGLQNFKTFEFSLNFGTGNKIRLSNGIVMEPYIEYEIPGTARCIGMLVTGGCIKEQNRTRVGVKAEF